MQQGHIRHDLLLSAADWQSRTMLLAELREASYEVMAVPGLRYAMRALIQRLVEPPLIVLDVFGDEEATPKRMESLLNLAPGVPLILITGTYHSADWEPLRPRVQALLRRPLSIGEIVNLVQRTISLGG